MRAHSSTVPSQFRRSRILVTALTALLLLSSLLSAQLATAATQQPDAARAAADWLRSQQLPDGSFPGFSGDADAGVTADAILAWASVGDTGGAHVNAAVAAIDAAVPANAENAGRLGKFILARVAVGLPASPEGSDLPAMIIATQTDTDWFGTSFYGHALAVLGLAAADAAVPQSALDAIYAAQTEEGSWGFNGDPTSGTGDSNTTAVVIQALAAADAANGAASIDAGIGYLSSIQAPDGTMPYDAASAEFGGDANSTALAVQAVVAAGGDPDTLPNGSLLDALLTFQLENGAFEFQSSWPGENLLATVQAPPALMLLPLPIIGEPPVVEPVDPALLAAVAPATAQADCAYFDVTMHNVCGEIATYWNTNGGLPIFGYPLSELVTLADGRTVQYFERAVLGLHLEWAGTPYVVLPTLIGHEAAERDGVDTAPAGDAQNGTCTYYAETQHNICGGFRAYWENQGGLFVYGFPLTEEFALEDGTVVQYFERARLEWRPGQWPERWDTLLTRLGAEQLERDLNPN